jgi:hypothetical protein
MLYFLDLMTNKRNKPFEELHDVVFFSQQLHVFDLVVAVAAVD